VSLLLVDDTDGRILAELETIDEAIEVLELLADDPAAEGLCLVQFGQGGGSLAAYGSTTTVRVLS
jgi:hypothetical protein